MVILLVILTILMFLAIDYSLQKRKSVAINRLSLFTASKQFYDGVFLTPSFTWIKLLDSGNMLLGIHPIIMGLFEKIDEIEILKNGQPVETGNTIMKIHSGEKCLNIVAPVDGVVTGTNSELSGNPNSWIYAIKPNTIPVKKWYIAEKARKWTSEKYVQIKNFFQVVSMTPDMAMPDGGELSVGVLSQFDETVCKKFQEEILRK